MNELRKPIPALSRKELYIGAGYLLFQLLLLPTILVQLSELFPAPIGVGTLNFLFFVINFLAVLLIFSKLVRKSLLRASRAPEETFVIALIGLGGYWVSMAVVSMIVTMLAPDFVNLNDSTISLIEEDSPLLMIIGTVLLVPTTEELLYRGLVFGGIYGKSPVAAYAVSATLFSFIHLMAYLTMYSPLNLVLAFFIYLPPGLVLAYSYRHSGTLVAPILIHTAINALGMLASR